MAITLVTITGPVVPSNGQAMAYRRIEFFLPTWDKEGSEVVQQTVVSVDLNASNTFSQVLWATSAGGKGLSYGVTAFWWSERDGRECSELLGYIAPSSGGPYALASLLTAVAPAPIAQNLLAQITAAQAASAASASAALADRLLAEAAKNAVDLGALTTAVTDAGGFATTASGHASTASAAATTATAEANRASRQNMMDPAGVPPRARDVIGVALRHGGTAMSFVDRAAHVVALGSPVPALSRPESVGVFARASQAQVFGANRRIQTLANNVLPYAYDPETGKLMGYWPSRAFTAMVSNDMTTWARGGMASAPSAGVGAGGPGTGWTFTDDLSTGNHATNTPVTVVIGTTYYQTICVKPGTLDGLRFHNTSGTDAFIDYDLNTGNPTTVGAGATPLPTKRLPDGRLKLRMLFTASATSGNFRLGFLSEGVAGYTGLGTGTMTFSDPMLAPTMERPEQPASSRVADSLTVDLTTVPWSNVAGSATVRAMAAPNTPDVSGLLEFRNSGSGAYLRLRAIGTGIILTDGTNSITATGENVGDVCVSLRWDEAWIEFYANGTPYGRIPNTLGTIAPNTAMIGHNQGGLAWDAPVKSVYFGPAWLEFEDLYDVAEMRLNGAPGVIGATPNRQIAIFANGSSFPLTHGDGDCYDPVFDPANRVIRWTCDFKGSRYTRTFPLDTRSSLTRTNRDLRIFLGKGQSRRVGINGYPAITTSDVDASRVAMFQTGIRFTSGYPEYADTLVAAEQFARLVPAKAQNAVKSGEASEARLAAEWLTYGVTNENILCINSAIGSTAYEIHAKGEEPWANESAALARAAWLMWRMGGRLKRLTCFWDQGDGNASDTVTAYRDKMAALYDDLNARWQPYRDWQTAQGFSDPGACRLILTQFNVSTASNSVPEAQAAAIGFGSRLIQISTPSYIFPATGIVGDNHYANYAMAWRGAFEARMLKAREDNAAADCLRMLSATRSGSTITVTLSTAAPNLTMPVVIDTTAVSNNADGRYGIRVDGITNGATITGVSVNGSNQIVVTLSAVPTGTLTVTAGLNPESTGNQGPLVQSCRTNFRDSTTGNDLVNGTNYPRRNWLVAGRVAVS